MNTTAERREKLQAAGFTVGDRDPRLNRNYSGRFMVVEAHTDDDFPTDDGANGPWCIVGDDLGELVNQAWDCWEHEFVITQTD